MKAKIFLYLAISFVLTMCCVGVSKPAKIDYLGTGYIQNNNGTLFVEINSAVYNPEKVYINTPELDRKAKMNAVDGMLITAFRLNDSSEVQFIAGDCSAEYLSEYFVSAVVWLVVGSIISMIFLVVDLISTAQKKQRRRIVYAD